MHELMIMMAEIMPEEKILEMIEEAVKEYRIMQNPQKKNALAAACTLFLTKLVAPNESMEAKLKSLREMRDWQALNPNKQKS